MARKKPVIRTEIAGHFTTIIDLIRKANFNCRPISIIGHFRTYSYLIHTIGVHQKSIFVPFSSRLFADTNYITETNFSWKNNYWFKFVIASSLRLNGSIDDHGKLSKLYFHVNIILSVWHYITSIILPKVIAMYITYIVIDH